MATTEPFRRVTWTPEHRRDVPTQFIGESVDWNGPPGADVKPLVAVTTIIAVLLGASLRYRTAGVGGAMF